MTFLSKAYYLATGWLPRPLPTTPEAFTAFRRALKDAYGVPDRDDCWITVCGQITSTPPNKMRRPWSEIANAAKRLDVNGLAQKEKGPHIKALEQKFAEAAAKFAKEQKDAQDAYDKENETKLAQANANEIAIPVLESPPSAAGDSETTH